jgi:hypothetical protein
LAMQRIQSALDGVPAEQRDYIANALLNLAVSRVPQTVAFNRTLGATVSYVPWRP